MTFLTCWLARLARAVAGLKRRGRREASGGQRRPKATRRMKELTTVSQPRRSSKQLTAQRNRRHVEVAAAIVNNNPETMEPRSRLLPAAVGCDHSGMGRARVRQ